MSSALKSPPSDEKVLQDVIQQGEELALVEKKEEVTKKVEEEKGSSSSATLTDEVPEIPMECKEVVIDDFPYDPDTDFPLSRQVAAVEAAMFLPPQKRVTGQFPGTKKTGRECKLQTNHFTVKLNFPKGVVYQYVVTVKPPWYGKRDYKRTDKQLYHDAIKEWKRLHPAAKNNTSSWVFDGNKQLFCTKAYSSAEIPDLRVKVWSVDEGREIDVDIKDVQLVGSIQVNKEILEWATSGRSGEIPQDALQALDVVLKELLPHGRQFPERTD